MPKATRGIYTPGLNTNGIERYGYTFDETDKSGINAEKPYIAPMSERANEASGKYEPADEYFVNTESEKTQEKEKATPAPKPEEDISDFDYSGSRSYSHIQNYFRHVKKSFNGCSN